MFVRLHSAFRSRNKILSCGALCALTNGQKSRVLIHGEEFNFTGASAEQFDNVGSTAVSPADPNYLWRGTVQKTTLMEIRVLGDNHSIMRFGVFPDLLVGGFLKSERTDVYSVRKIIREELNELWR